MCLDGRVSVNIDSVTAYKIFRLDPKGLQTAFWPSYSSGLFYTPNTEISVDLEDSCFFAFKERKDAINVVYNYKKWNFVGSHLLVLPVELKEVIGKGHLISQSNDPQVMDSYYDSYEAKKITVYDSPENRETFYKEICRLYLRRTYPKGIHRIALEKILPELQ